MDPETQPQSTAIATPPQDGAFQPVIEPSVEKPYTEKPKSKLVPILLGIGIILLGGIYGLLSAQMQKPKTTQVTTEPTPTVEPTILIGQPLSSIASSSAFTTLETSIASLSASINALNVSDTTINPPTLDLPLGLEVK